MQVGHSAILINFKPNKIMMNYPRDMIGYGAIQPEVKWPNNARLALQIVLNYEEGGESNILHGDDSSEAFLSESNPAIGN